MVVEVLPFSSIDCPSIIAIGHSPYAAKEGSKGSEQPNTLLGITEYDRNKAFI
jgi:hypothetical protein